MKRYCLPTVLLLSLLLNVGVIVAVGFHFVRAEPLVGGTATDTAAPVALTEYLRIKPEQLAEWRRKEEGFLRELNAAWLEIRKHRERMIREIFSDQPDLALIERERRVIAQLQEQQQRQVIAQLMEERKILDADQRQALARLLIDQNSGRSMEEVSKQLHQH